MKHRGLGNWTRTIALITLFAVGAAGVPAQAAELNVICAVALERVVKPLAAEFENTTGVVVHLTTGEAGELANEARRGVNADLILLPPALLARLAERGLVRSDAQVPLVSTSLGLATRTRDPLQDVSTPKGLRATLLGATRIYHLDPSIAPSGMSYLKLVQELGIAEQVKAKSVIKPPQTIDADMANDAGAGPVLGFLIKSGVTHTPGAIFLGPVAGDAPSPSWTAALGPHASDAAAAFLKLLQSPATKQRFAADGFDVAP